MIKLKTPEQIDIMDEANKIVHDILDHAEKHAKVGVTSSEIDRLMEEKLNDYSDAKSAFKYYRGYPNVSCISVNNEVVHGIPKDIPFKEGDLVSIDFGVYYNYFAGDAARTFIIGKPNNDLDVRLVEETKKGLFKGIEQMVIGNRLYDIGKAINKVSKENNFGNVRNFSGHGIGGVMHEKPSVFNYIELNEPNIRLQEGLVLALEPMFTLGGNETTILEDKWTVETADKTNAAHWELSVAITKDGPRVLGNDNY
jgi:methionyl aminopeptidase